MRDTLGTLQQRFHALKLDGDGQLRLSRLRRDHDGGLQVKSVVQYTPAWVKSQSRMASTSNQETFKALVEGRWVGVWLTLKGQNFIPGRLRKAVEAPRATSDCYVCSVGIAGLALPCARDQASVRRPHMWDGMHSLTVFYLMSYFIGISGSLYANDCYCVRLLPQAGPGRPAAGVDLSVPGHLHLRRLRPVPVGADD